MAISCVAIDDDQLALLIIKAYIGRFPELKMVQVFNNADAGLAFLQDNPVDILFIDINMPGISGIDLVRQLNTQPLTIFTTGDKEFAYECFQLSALDFLLKPIAFEHFSRSIQKALDYLELRRSKEKLSNNNGPDAKFNSSVLPLHPTKTPDIYAAGSRVITVLFCDIRNYTSLAEKVETKHTVALLQSYYSIMTEVIKQHHGTVIQYVGDEIFAAFGAPIAHETNELNAVACAVQMIKQLDTLNKLSHLVLPQPVQVGIGINAGEVFVGTIGSADKMDYSVTGDTVNTGKRIESLTKDKPNSIFISETVYQKVKGHFSIKFLDPVLVKGKQKEMAVFEVTNTPLSVTSDLPLQED